MKMNRMKIAGVLLIAILTLGSLAGCGNTGGTKDSSSTGGEFATFAGEDLNGNKVDQSIIKKNKATVINFWFNGCAACVEEMPDLEQFNKTLQEKGAELIGVNAELASKEDVKEAKDILQKQGATYQNITLTEGKTAVDYMKNLTAFPTTIVVDQNGNIVGKPICGSLNKETMQEILNRIDNLDGTSK